MSVKKLKNGRYQAIVQLPIAHGRQQIKKTFERKIDADRWEAQQRASLDGTSVVRNKAPILKDFFQEAWVQEALLRVEESTKMRYSSYLELQILPTFGNMALDRITIRGIDQWLNDLRAGGLSPKTINGALVVLKKVLSDAVRWGVLAYNPIKDVKALPEDDKEMEFWQAHEARRLLSYAQGHKPHWYPVFFIALNTGMRLNEIVGLQWDCVDLDRKTITVRRQFCEKTGTIKERTKGKRIRRVPINADLHRLLVELKSGRAGEYVVPRMDYRHSSRELKKMAERVGVRPIRFHDLRHSFAAMWMMSGGKIYELQKVLGHASIAMTERYAHLAPEHLQGATDFLNLGPTTAADVIPLRSATAAGANC